MKKNLAEVKRISSFLAYEKDIELILRKIFVESRPYSDDLKRLLVINTKDCLDAKDNEKYNKKIKEMTLSKLVEEGYIRLEPKIYLKEHEEVKSYILISFNNFTRNAKNPEFRDCTVNFDIISYTDYWDIGDYRIRPLKIAGYIDGILNEAKLSGIGTFNFMGCDALLLSQELSGYSLSYRAIHGSDDRIKEEEDNG